MSILAEYVEDIGKGLEKATEAYNKSVGSIETRVLASARRFKDLGIASGRDIPVLEPVQITPRRQAMESLEVKVEVKDK
jgi:DNA recombination protein RmuC